MSHVQAEEAAEQPQLDLGAGPSELLGGRGRARGKGGRPRGRGRGRGRARSYGAASDEKVGAVSVAAGWLQELRVDLRSAGGQMSCIGHMHAGRSNGASCAHSANLQSAYIVQPGNPAADLSCLPAGPGNSPQFAMPSSLETCETDNQAPDELCWLHACRPLGFRSLNPKAYCPNPSTEHPTSHLRVLNQNAVPCSRQGVSRTATTATRTQACPGA